MEKTCKEIYDSHICPFVTDGNDEYLLILKMRLLEKKNGVHFTGISFNDAFTTHKIKDINYKINIKTVFLNNQLYQLFHTLFEVWNGELD